MESSSEDFAAMFLARNDLIRQSYRLFDLVMGGKGKRQPQSSPNQSTQMIHDVDSNHMLRSLYESERIMLQTTCQCSYNNLHDYNDDGDDDDDSNWNGIHLLLHKDDVLTDQRLKLKKLVSNTTFSGMIILDMTTSLSESTSNSGKEKTLSSSSIDWQKHLPFGIHSNIMISNCIISLRSARVYKNTCISNTYIGPETTVLNCSNISASSTNSKSGYGFIDIEVGPESGGGRLLKLSIEETMIGVCSQLQHQQQQQQKLLLPSSSKSNERMMMMMNTNTSNLPLNFLCRGNVIRDTPSIANIFLHDNASIVAATDVTNVTMLPHSMIGQSSNVTNALLQWNAEIVGNSHVTDTLLMERSQSGPNNIVASSVLGPDVHVSAGEVHASIIGPNTNAHHQSLVIGILWPMGRGNVGYGANVGSNHTGRLPDQETSCGEGIFWGLSCIIKFPIDLTYSPYSIIAAGTTLPPQRICMPFSLIVEGKGNENEIIPGWVLQSSPYTLARSEKKFATRRKAKRHDFYTGWKIIRQGTIDMCRWARMALQQHTDTNNVDVPGIGANVLTERARKVGITAYNDCIQRYALRGLLSWMVQMKERNGFLDMNMIQNEFLFESTDGKSLPMIDPITKVEWPVFPWEVNNAMTNTEWNYQRRLLVEEFPPTGTATTSESIYNWLETILKNLIILEKDYARRIHKSKKRDDIRGVKTIPGYAHSHVLADNDPVIFDANANVQHVESTVSELLLNLNASNNTFRSKL